MSKYSCGLTVLLGVSAIAGLALPGWAEERSPLTPLNKGGTGQRLEVPLLKGD